jgi:hypothetical protein
MKRADEAIITRRIGDKGQSCLRCESLFLSLTCLREGETNVVRIK